MLYQDLCIISNPLMNSNWSYSPKTFNSGQNRRFFLSHVTSKFYRWPLKTVGHLFYTMPNFVHNFKSIGEVKLELQSRNAQFASKLAFFACMTLKFDGWLWKTIENLFYTILSFVHHFKSIGEMKLELQSGNAQFGSKLAIFWSHMT